MQNKLPVSGQNARLYVVISAGKISMFFIYADYEENTSFSKYTVYPLPSGFELKDLDHLVKDILTTWGGLFGLDLRVDKTGIIHSIFFNARPIGGTELIVDGKYYGEDFKSKILGVSPTKYGEGQRLDGAMKYMRSYNPSNLVWVVLDWDYIYVYSLNRLGVSQSIDVDLREFKIENNINNKSTIKQIESVIGVHLESENIKNTLANVLTKEITISKSAQIWDVLRSFITASLIKVKDPSFKNFGMKSDDAHLVITGDMASVLSGETLFISVIDGLQLRGKYRVILDSQLRSIVAQSAIGGKSFACPLKELFYNRFLYLSSESEGRSRDGDAAFTGKIEITDDEDQIKVTDIMGQVGQFHTIPLGSNGTIQLKPEKAVFFPNLSKKGEYLEAGFSAIDSKAVIDCRKIPVVYGPDENANSQRISMWVNGLKLYE